MKTATVILALALSFGALFGEYVIEWSTPVAYSMANAYTANQGYNYDITGDSIPELFVMDSSALKVFSGVTHSLIWSIPLSYTYGGYPMIANTDGDVNKELVFGAYSYSYPNYSGRFFIYDCQSRSLEFSSPVRNGYPSVAVADIDGDNKSEVCMVSGAAGNRLLEVYGSTDADVEEMPEPLATPVFGLAVPNPAGRFVRLSLGRTGTGPVAVFDLGGRIVRTLPATGPDALWDCTDDAGQPVPAGTYLFRAETVHGRVEVTP